MMRCPECSFIYEDDQCLCDMDGKALVRDLGPILSKAEAGSKPNGLDGKSRSRRFGVWAITAIVLAVVLLAIYYFLTRSRTPQPGNPAPPPIRNQSSTKSSPAEQPAQSPVLDRQPDKPEPSTRSTGSPSALKARTTDKDGKTTSPAKKASDPRLTVSRRLPPLRHVPPLPQLPAAKPEEKKSNRNETSGTVVVTNPEPAKTTSQSASVSSRKESGVKSFLKRTGRVLAKPFKF